MEIEMSSKNLERENKMKEFLRKFVKKTCIKLAETAIILTILYHAGQLLGLHITRMNY
jgi:hypothetical protein